jgi:hypothetical protein
MTARAARGADDGARGKAGAAALLLLLAGVALGVLLDRVWLQVPEARATPLTAEALADHLDLRPSDAERVRALLDSMHADVLAATAEGPEALAATARLAHERLEAALPPDARPAFRSWVEGHHRQMMERMQRAGMHEGRMPGGGMQPGGLHDGALHDPPPMPR